MSLFRSDKPYELTGRHVLYWLLAFFGAVMIVNAVMVRAATSTFGGVQTQSSYKAGLTFRSEVARAERQQAMHWRVDGKLRRVGADEAVLDITVHDAQGAPVAGLTADAMLAHPIDSRRDHAVRLRAIGPGAFHGQTESHVGQWELIVDLYRGDERVFRSRSRVSLR